jgi:uncharacterized repeat protein (TIGR03803 family)
MVNGEYYMRTLRRSFLAASMLAAISPIASAAPTYKVLHVFHTATDGFQPQFGVTIGAGGVLYGTTTFGGPSQAGTIFAVKPPKTGSTKWRESILYSFMAKSDGANPLGGLAIGANGVLYGGVGTSAGGDGMEYSLTPANHRQTMWAEATLHAFSGADGDGPDGTPLVGPDGSLYGMTLFGGASGNGGVFKLTPPAPGSTTWTETTLWSFTGGADGKFPLAGLTAGPGGVLYGTTQEGGSVGAGVVFQLTPPGSGQTQWTETVIHNFAGQGGGDGADPFDSGVTIGKSGALFGTTIAGGTASGGTVYELTPPRKGATQWSETVLHSFLNGTDGLEPISGVAVDASGALYGMSAEGGPNNLGLVYKLVPPGKGSSEWSLLNLHTFAGGNDGGNPQGLLKIDAAGNVYGTTVGDLTRGGTVYTLAP